MNNLLLSIFLAFCACGLMSAQDSIIYKLPAKVETELLDKIQSSCCFCDNKSVAVFMGKNNESDNEYYVDKITYNPENTKSLYTQVALETHRYMKVGNEFFPLFFRTDERWSSPTPITSRGSIFDRDGKMIKNRTILENPINFCHNGWCNSLSDSVPTFHQPIELPGDTIRHIFYIINDIIEYKIYEYINSYFSESKKDICFFIGNISLDSSEPCFVLLSVAESQGDYVSYLKSVSNRYLVIDEEYYPLLFDLDFIFAEGSISSKYVICNLFSDNGAYEFTFPREFKIFESVDMRSVNVSSSTLDKD